MACDTVQMASASIEYIDGLYGYAMVLTQDRAEAEDLVQQAYLRAASGVGRPPEKSNLKGWFFKILRNAWLNQLKKQRNGSDINQVDGDDRHTPEHCLSSPTTYADMIDKECVRAAIQKLPIESRELILLREFENLTYDEIADALDCPKGTVISHLAIARSGLRVLLSSRSTRSEPSKELVRDEGWQ